MTKEIIANCNPKMIKNARINSNIREEEVIHFMEHWKKWENGEEQVTWEDLRLISKFYHKPTFYFFLEDTSDVGSMGNYTIEELFEELQLDFDNFKQELMERLELCSHVTLKDL